MKSCTIAISVSILYDTLATKINGAYCFYHEFPPLVDRLIYL
jgi:hypothetical protein